MADKQCFFITGAAGFIGGWLCEALSLRGDAEVVAGVKSWSKAARIARFPVQIVAYDILDPGEISRAMPQGACVIHCAVGSKETNLKGTQNLLDVAEEKKARHFVFLSSAVVYGDATGDVDESCPTQFTGNEYADSKIRAEQWCREFYETELPITILRPSIVYGPFSAGWTTNIARKLQSGNWRSYDERGEGLCNLIYVKDLISAILLAADNDNGTGKTFNVNGPDIITWNQYFQVFNAALNLPSLKKISPGRARMRSAVRDRINLIASYCKGRFGETLREMNHRNQLAARLFGQVKGIIDTVPSNYELEGLYSRKSLYVSTQIRDAIGFVPKFGLSAGMEESVLWLRHYGIVT